MLSASEIKLLDQCSRRWYFTYHMNLEPMHTAPQLRFGTLVHQALESYYMDKGARNPGDIFHELILKEPEDTTVDEGMAQVGEAVLRAYPEWDQNQPEANWEVVGTEVEFHTLIAGVQVAGRIDLIWRAPNGSLVLADHKTCKSFPNPKSLALDKQHGVYMLAIESLYDEPVAGFSYNHLRKTDPKKARSPLFQRTFFGENGYHVRSYINDVRHAEARRTFLATLELEDTPSEPGILCSSCEFYEPCLALRQMKSEDAKEMLYGLYKERPARYEEVELAVEE